MYNFVLYYCIIATLTITENFFCNHFKVTSEHLLCLYVSVTYFKSTNNHQKETQITSYDSLFWTR